MRTTSQPIAFGSPIARDLCGNTLPTRRLVRADIAEYLNRLNLQQILCVCMARDHGLATVAEPTLPDLLR
jgi:hypothetical protein